jgi:hypothetical protein
LLYIRSFADRLLSLYKPATASVWMDSSGWRPGSIDWAQYAYQQLLEPRLNVKGRMALFFLVAFLWAISWFVTRGSAFMLTESRLTALEG